MFILNGRGFRCCSFYNELFNNFSANYGNFKNNPAPLKIASKRISLLSELNTNLFDVILRVIKKSTMLMWGNLFTHKASGSNFNNVNFTA